MGLAEELAGQGRLERRDRTGQLRDLAEHMSRVQAPCFVDDLLSSIDSCLQFTFAQLHVRADGVALRASAAVAGQA